MRNGNRFFFILSKSTFFLIPAGHQDRIVNGGTQLDGAQDDAGDERQRSPGKVGNAKIDGNGGLNAGHQNDRDGQAAERDQSLRLRAGER